MTLRPETGEPRLKLLYCGAKTGFLNPTSSLLPRVLERIGSVDFFGPGFSTEDDLRLGLHRVEGLSDYDAVFVDDLLSLPVAKYSPDRLIPAIRRGYSLHFPTRHLSFLWTMRKELEEAGIPVVYSLLANDLYNWTGLDVEVAGASPGFLLGGGMTTTRPLTQMMDLEAVPWGKQATDEYYDFLKESHARVIDFPLFVGPDDERDDHWSIRRPKWAVPGVQYPARRQARNELGNCDLLARWLPLSQVAHRVSHAVGFMPDRALKWLQRRQLNHLAANRYAFTCGSPLGQPIRKFFEIPAAGTLLVAEPFHGAHHLGFDHRSNFICAHPRSLCDLHKELESSLDDTRQIAAAGRRLIREKHSITARATQLEAALSLIIQRRFGGSSWQDGLYVLAQQ